MLTTSFSHTGLGDEPMLEYQRKMYDALLQQKMAAQERQVQDMWGRLDAAGQKYEDSSLNSLRRPQVTSGEAYRATYGPLELLLLNQGE